MGPNPNGPRTKYVATVGDFWPTHRHLRSTQHTKGHKGKDMAHGVATDSPNLNKDTRFTMGRIGCISDGLYDGLYVSGLYNIYIYKLYISDTYSWNLFVLYFGTSTPQKEGWTHPIKTGVGCRYVFVNMEEIGEDVMIGFGPRTEVYLWDKLLVIVHAYKDPKPCSTSQRKGFYCEWLPPILWLFLLRVSENVHLFWTSSSESCLFIAQIRLSMMQL